MKYLIGIDIGTQGTKGKMFDTDMNAVSVAFEASNLISPEPGTIWQEPEEIYSSVQNVISQLMKQSKAAKEDVAAIGIDSQMAGVMGIGEDGEAVTPYDSWLDNRCRKYVDFMREKAGNRITQITGGPLTCTHGPKILWWKYEKPEIYKKIFKFVQPHAYVVGKMTGLGSQGAYFDYTGLQYSGFGDNYQKKWSRELLELFEVDESKMARILSPFEVVGRVTETFANACGLKAGTKVVAGAGDTAASVFGAGLFGEDRILDCAGTASVLCSVVDSYIPDTKYQTLTLMRSPVDGYWFPLAYINGGGLCIRWFRDEMTGKPCASYEELEAEAKAVKAGSDGLLFIPHFAGRILPNEPQMRGSYTGLTWNHKRGHMYRAVLESIAYEYAYYKKIMEDLYPKSSFQEAYAIGGGAQSELFLQIKADVLNINMHSFEAADTALLGSAVIAGYGTGLIKDYQQAIQNVLKEKDCVIGHAEEWEEYKPYAQAYLNTMKIVNEVYKQRIYS